LKSRKELQGSTSQVSPTQPDVDTSEAVTMDEAAQRTRLGRTFLYDAIDPRKAAEKGLPVLPSLKIGKLRRVRVEALRTWLRTLEARAA
jgi:excisionase family DNA binding protein